MAIVLIMGALLLYAHFTRSVEPAQIVVEPRTSDVRVEQGLYYLPLRISNAGGSNVESLEISVTLDGAEPAAAAVSVPFLADGETVEAVAVFERDPRQAELATTFSYLEP